MEATQKQIDLLKRLKNKDFTGIDKQEASHMIEEALAEQGKEVAKLPEQKPEVLAEHKKVIDKVVKDPTRTSIERQKSLDIAERWCEACKQKGEEVKTTHIISIAKLFEAYLDGGAE